MLVILCCISTILQGIMFKSQNREKCNTIVSKDMSTDGRCFTTELAAWLSRHSSGLSKEWDENIIAGQVQDLFMIVMINNYFGKSIFDDCKVFSYIAFLEV